MRNVKKVIPAKPRATKGAGGTATHKSPDERELIKSTLAKHYLQGAGVPAVAPIIEAMGIKVNIKTLYTYLNDLKKEWLENRLAHMDEQVASELAKIDNLERVAWEAYMASVGEFTKEQEKIQYGAPSGRNKKGEEKAREILKVKEKRTGGNDYLKTVQWCIEKRLEIIGYGKLHLNVQNVQNNTIVQENKVNAQFNGGFTITESQRDLTKKFATTSLSRQVDANNKHA